MKHRIVDRDRKVERSISKTRKRASSKGAARPPESPNAESSAEAAIGVLDADTLHWVTPEAFSDVDLAGVTSSRRFNQFRNQSNRAGLYYCASTGEHVAHESYAELVVATMIDFEVRPTLLRAQPFRVRVDDTHVAYPDYVYRASDGELVVVEVKSGPVTDETQLARFAAIRDVLAAYDMTYLLRTPPDQIYEANLMWLAQYRRPHPLYEGLLDESADLLMKEFDLGSLREGEAPQELWPAAMHFIWHHRFEVDLHLRLDLNTIVSPLAAEASA